MKRSWSDWIKYNLVPSEAHNPIHKRVVKMPIRHRLLQIPLEESRNTSKSHTQNTQGISTSIHRIRSTGVHRA